MVGGCVRWRITIVLQKGKACDPASGKLGEVTVARGFSVSADFEKDVEETRAASFISNSIGSIDASPQVQAGGQVLGPSQQSAVR